MCTFLAINTSSVQFILPATVVALMGAAANQIFITTILATGMSTRNNGFTLMELLLVLLIIGIISLIPIINSSFLSSYQEGGVTQINQLLNSLKKESQLIRKPIAIEKNNENYYLVSYEDNLWKNYDIFWVSVYIAFASLASLLSVYFLTETYQKDLNERL